jgi:DNA-binding protein WhiA
MSFTTQVKEETSGRWDYRECCYKAELTGLIDTIGNVNISSQGLSLHISTQNPHVARRIYRLISEKIGIEAKIYTRTETRLLKKQSFQVAVLGQENTVKLLKLIGRESWPLETYIIPESVLEWSCCRNAYLRGVFLASGSVSDPKKSYHLEMITHWPEHAVQILALLDRHEIKAQIIERKKNQVIYLKDSNAIADFLVLIGAVNAMLEYENTRALKETINMANRMRNCDLANTERQSIASDQQIDYIEFLHSRGEYSKLTSALKEAADLRLLNPEDSLRELAEQLQISKSALNHRFRSLKQKAQEKGWEPQQR